MTIEGRHFVCESCGTRLPLTASHMKHLTSGWVKSRTGGGANAVHRPIFDGRTMCAPCFMESERGEQLTIPGT